MYFLALRASNLGVHAAIKRRRNLSDIINRMKKNRTRLLASLRSETGEGSRGGGFPHHIQSTYMQLLQATAALRSALVLQAISKVYLDDDEVRRDTLMFYRLHAVLMTRAVDPREFPDDGEGGVGAECVPPCEPIHAWPRRHR